MSILRGQVEPVTRRKQVWLYAIAVISLGLYLWIALRYPLAPSLANPRASWATLVEPNTFNAALHVAIYLALILLYLAALRNLIPMPGKEAISHGRQIFFIVVAWLACSGALLLASPSGESHDIYDYLFRGRMIVEYQANPLAEVPDSFDISTPYSRYLAWRYHVDTYGPIWEGLSAAVAGSVHQIASWLGWWDESAAVCPKSPESCRLLIAYISGYRLLAIILTGLSGWLITRIVSRTHPALVPAALAAWLWSPLTLISTAVGGHNDAAMLVLVLLSCWFLQQEHPFWSLIMLILAAHVKLTALIWLPVYAIWIFWRYGWRRTLKVFLAGSVISVLLSWSLYLPFGGWQTLPRMLEERSKFLANSIWQILNYLMVKSWGWSSDRAHQLTTRLPTWLFAAVVLVILVWFFYFRNKCQHKGIIVSSEKNQILWYAMLVVSLLYLLVGSFWFQSWYILWILAPAALLPKSQFTRLILPWLVFGALSSNVIMDFYYKTSHTEVPPIYNYILPVVIIWGPALLATCSRFAWQRLRS